MIPSSDAALVLRGWAESKTRLRVVCNSKFVTFSAFCTVFDARDDAVAFVIAGDSKNMIEFGIEGCGCGFRDKPPDEDSILPIGGTVESVVVITRPGFDLYVMLLGEE